MAVWCAWWLTKHPDTTILYISATSQLAEDQLFAIKNILDSKKYKKYWPEMLEVEEGKREKWAATAISVDHPIRKKEMTRDPTVRTAGLTTNTTGFHADIVIADDVVVPDNAYTEDGRRKCANALSQMSSIKNAGGMIKACGTRYHPADQYDIWKKQKEYLYDKEDNITGQREIWEIMEEVVEDEGKFLWPREYRSDGKAFGFNRKVLARIESEYEDRIQFHAQYYNNPNDPESVRISRSKFQYYDNKYLSDISGKWCFKEEPMNIYAAIDFAFSLNKKADFTAIVVIGITKHGDIYVLDIDRFKTDRISEYFAHVKSMYQKWSFKKIRAEVTVAQAVIVRDMKQMCKEDGLNLKIDEFRPVRTMGSKEERMSAILEPRYDNLAIWHFRGGFINLLEEEILLARPPHDDIKDSLANAIDISVQPKDMRSSKPTGNVLNFNRRFGGIGTTMHRG
jgi:ribosomal protein L14